MSGDLVAFLRARLDEDEKWAQTRNAGLRARWPTDPERMLREVEAKRKILTLIRIAREMTDTEPLETDIDRASAGAIIATGHMVLIALATVYRDHPDYRQEWAP